MILIFDPSRIRVGWAIKQDDNEENKSVIKYGVKVLNSCQRLTPSKKRTMGSGHHNECEIVFYWYIDSCRNGLSTAFRYDC